MVVVIVMKVLGKVQEGIGYKVWRKGAENTLINIFQIEAPFYKP